MPETKDLILKAGTPEDAADLYRNLWSRAEVFQFLFSRPSADYDAGCQRTSAYAAMQQEVHTEFFVYEKSSRQAIGIAGIKELSPGQWTITDIALGPDSQRMGYGAQIVRALSRLAFQEHQAESLAYCCFHENVASRQVALSCGFTFSHSCESELRKDGRNVLLDHYQLQRVDFQRECCK